MYVEEMSKDLALPRWHGQRPWLEIYFAVLLDESRRRALWIRETLFVPKEGDGRATIWGAWFDKDASPASRAAKRIATLDDAHTGDEPLIRIGDSQIARTSAAGSVEGLAWDARWSGGRNVGVDMPSWLPAPLHARAIVHDAETEATITVGDQPTALRGRAYAMHVWGKRHVPTLHWLWTPWLGDASLEITAVSLRDRLSLGLSSFSLDGPQPIKGTPATAAHPHGLLAATVAGARRLVHVQAWAEPDELVGYVYRDVDGSDEMVAQSDIASAHMEVFTRRSPGLPWQFSEERRLDGGVALEIQQHAPLPGVDYIGWDATTAQPKRKIAPPRGDVVDWPELGAIIALGPTYPDHAKELAATLDREQPPAAFAKDARTFHLGAAHVRVPHGDELFAALAALEPGLREQLAQRLPRVPAITDYEGQLALVALDTIDDARLVAGVAQPFGIAVCNDLTARICQVLGEGMPNRHDYWAVAKSFPRFLPIAEQVWAPPDGLALMPDVTIITRVNGEERQHASTKKLAYQLPALVRAARSQLGRPLARGDVILTGTPGGVGIRLSAIQRRLARLVKDRFRKAELLVSLYATSSSLLRPGDVVEVEAGPAGSVRARLTV
jgi:2-keto-4-pentenoate hydratase/2-oxohepta-3-ene-1,7-dioic acid hydratase in catechol pathway